METHNNDIKQKMRAYRRGFGIGVLIGIAFCFGIGRIAWIAPLFFGIIGGALSYQLNDSDNG